MAETRVMSEDEWDSKVLAYLAARPAFQFQTEQAFADAIAREASGDPRTSREAFMAALWRLVARELVYIDLGSVGSHDWMIRISLRGTIAARDPTASPDSPDFLPLMWARTPDASTIVRAYAQEAVETYRRQNLLASVVMVGIASEAAFTDLGESFKAWLTGDAHKRFTETFDRDGVMYSRKWEEFRRRLEPRKPDLPSDLRDSLPIVIDAVAHLLRLNRNEHAHPKQITIDRETQYVNLRLFAMNTEWMYRLKRFFDDPTENSP